MIPAAAVAATPTALDVPNNGAPPQVAYDPISQNTFVAWTDPQSTALGAIDLCVILKNTSTCEGGGPVALTVSTAENPNIKGSNTIGLGGITILPNGDVVVIATPVSNSSIAFESPGDGSAFLTSGQGLQDGGGFISPVSLFYTPGNVVALSNTDVGLLDDYGDTFSDSPYAGPEYPATLTSSNTNPPPGGQTSSVYPRKALDTNGPEIAAEPAPSPAAAGTDIVVGVGDNYAGPNLQLSDCTNGDDVGTGYGLDVGVVNGASSASGTLNHQNSSHITIPSYSGLACNAENPVVASPDGGTQGIGVLENEGNGLDGGTTFSLDYRPFLSTVTGGSFGAASLVSNLTDSAGQLDVTDDSTDGVYASWTAGGGVQVNYSADGGAVWGPPVTIPEPTTGSISDPVITAIGGGTFELAFDNNGSGQGRQTYTEVFSYQTLEQTPTTLATSQRSGTTTATNLSIPAGTVGESDTATISGTNASLATGTVEFALFDNSSCTGTPTFSGAVAASGGTATIADDASPGLPVGTYYWKASYVGNTFNQPSSSTCGSEKLTVTQPSSISSGATTNGSTVTITVSCSGPCVVTVTLDTSTGGAASVASGSEKKKAKTVKLGGGTFTLRKGKKEKLHIKLTKKGKQLVKKDHDKLKATLLVSTKTAHGTFKASHSLKIRK